MSGTSLAGRTALITGGSKGLGKAMALALAQEGARIVLVARNETLLGEVQRVVQGCGSGCEFFRADVTDEADIQRLGAAITGGVDILINNAGINIRKPITEFTLGEWNQVMTTNLTGAFLMCRAFVPGMKEKRWGRIINMTSIMSHVALPERTAYAASKTALLGLTRALALELAPHGVTVNGISPGPFATEMNLPLLNNPELNQQFISRIPLGRWGKVEEVGQLAVYLCSEQAGFITGTDIIIDGGWCAQ